ncbi:MAG: curli assembly protein CsgF [Bacteroidetes bacterium]|nr:MAG: curli assembly protein CsgF [Bacteroidota bacterium]
MKKSFLLLLVASFCAPVFPSNLVYTPVNPVFGGSPLNGSVLMSVAQAQNTYKDPKRAKKKTAAQKFSETLQRSILNRIAFATSSTLIDANGNLIPTATPLQTNDFTISITDIGGGNVGVTVVDKITGQTTEFSVCQGAATNQVCP